jgi:epoxyqueuosine reductase
MTIRPGDREILRERAIELGFDACGFTVAGPAPNFRHFERWLAAGRHGEMAYLSRSRAVEKRADLQRVLPGARTVIVLAVAHSDGGDGRGARGKVPSVGGAEQGPVGVVARYARHEDYHEVLEGPMRALTASVNAIGGGGTRSLWYVDTGPILERDLGERAGVGFIGKHTGLIRRGGGNWFLLSEIVTTLEIEPDSPERNRCGNCVRCLEACPTRAITGPFQLDARRCISYLTIELRGSIPEEFRRAIGDRIFGCDDCLAACPWNRFAREGALMRRVARPELGRLDLIELLSLTEETFRQRFRETPLWRVKRRGMVRNACVALGNVGGAGALEALSRAARDADPLIAEHGRWAIDEITTRLRNRDCAVG